MSAEQPTIERIQIKGFKSIREADITLGKLNVVIGANGAGKSNLVSFFKFLQASLLDGHEKFVGQSGGANSVLHLGSGVTEEISTTTTICRDGVRGSIHQRLFFQPPDRLFSSVGSIANNLLGWENGYKLGSCSIVVTDVVSPDPSWFREFERFCGVYHFDDSTLHSRIRTPGYIEDNYALRSDGGNLAAFLHRLKHTDPKVYQRIVMTVRLVAPFFDDFSLEPSALSPTQILLNWKQKDTDYLFGPHQLSDGTLRMIALITLLLQPESLMPKLIVIDEPEIGLHPYALTVLVSLIRQASHDTQVIVATQSPQLLDECEPDEIICADRRGNESIFTRPNREKLEEWLTDYSLGEVWRKNIIGGGPH